MQTTAWDKEWNKLLKAEKTYVKNGINKKPSLINQGLEEKVPEKLKATLEAAFTKSFQVIFEKGTEVIEKTYRRDALDKQYQINRFSLDLEANKKSFRAFSKQASAVGAKTVLASGIKGIGLGALGIGVPDIPIFIGLLLRSIYEIALGYGYAYNTPKEQAFILLLIEAALTGGKDLERKDAAINAWIAGDRFAGTTEAVGTGIDTRTGVNLGTGTGAKHKTGTGADQGATLKDDLSQAQQIAAVSSALSGEVLYMKFLQGIPLVGAVGGIYDAVFTGNILSYAKLKYHRRFLFDWKYGGE